ncbi:MAG: arginine--tRNA ligase [Verrucomicrobia bacterium]|nr:MAG: arginine--tRNA ligase [Verrucomicrobiota bacterium]
MQIPFNVVDYLENSILTIAKELPELNNEFTPDVRTADPKFGDFQANGIMASAKRLKTNPRQLAEKLVTALQNSPQFDSSLITISIAGPGFINFKFSPKFYLDWLKRYHDEKSFQSASGNIYQNKRISIDYSSPNTAKQMHVGHIRSMVIGEAIQRMLRFCGATIIRDNHIGDWGTQFGIIIMGVKEFKYDLDAPHEDPLEDLENIYKKGNALFESSDEWKDRARSELLKLQQGDPQNVQIWEKVNQVSYAAFQKIYDMMNIHFDVVLGESFYRTKVDRIYKELTETGIAKESQGALVVLHPSDTENAQEYPFIIRKKDGASNYCSTDLATALHHVEETKVDEMIYVTDGRQQDHFKYLFKTVNQWFDAKGYKKPEFKHAWFGTILGEDGKAIKTRSGNPIKLKDLLQEAIDRAYKIVQEKNPTLDEESHKHIAKVVGLGAVRYADLSQNRTSDYIFDWDKILAFEGNTAPYLLYAIARIHSIFKKANIPVNSDFPGDLTLETPEELSLARKIMEFPVALKHAIAELRPHILGTYLFELSGSFSTFYNANKVIVEEENIRNRRLLLCARTLQILETGLHLLGLETLERM